MSLTEILSSPLYYALLYISLNFLLLSHCHGLPYEANRDSIFLYLKHSIFLNFKLNSHCCGLPNEANRDSIFLYLKHSIFLNF